MGSLIVTQTIMQSQMGQTVDPPNEAVCQQSFEAANQSITQSTNTRFNQSHSNKKAQTEMEGVYQGVYMKNAQLRSLQG